MAPRILLLADDAALCAVLCDILADAGYTVLPHAESWPAPHVVQAHRPDLILLDYFPNPGAACPAPWVGWAADPATAAVPLILLSDLAHADPRRPVPSAAVPVDVLDKPFDLDDLLALVQRRLAGPAPAAPQEVCAG